MFNRYFSPGTHDHSSEQRVGILLVNLGTPQAPRTRDLRVYLRQFLSDPRIIEVHPVLWWFILNLFILPRRPKRSAALYANIWKEEGSPLLSYTKSQAKKLQATLHSKYGSGVVVDYAMRLGQPDISSVARTMSERGVMRLLVLPLYPQYSGTTTGSVFDAVTEALKCFRFVPELRFINQFMDHPLYIEALAESITHEWNGGKPEKLVFSFHGIPVRYFKNGDPYFCHCQKTARLVAKQLKLKEGDFVVCFQSRFGAEKWLEPYTDETLKSLAKSGVQSVDVVCPGFVSDCLETIDEIDRENRHLFMENGGQHFRFIQCLNDSASMNRLLNALVEENVGGWLRPEDELKAAANEVRSQYEAFLKRGPEA